MFKRVTIIGLGLIGGSLGLAIKEKKLARRVIGVSRRRSTIKRALSLKAASYVTLDVECSVKDSDFVILAAPVLEIIDIAKRIAPALKRGAILIDVGSTKKEVVEKIEEALPKGVYFIGAHPLAGSEHSGVKFSDKDLFKGSICIITKTNRTDRAALKKVKRFWEKIGMKVKVMNPKEHDKVISKLSHLPHAIASSLVNSCGPKHLALSSTGFRDTTRIASSPPGVWKDIFLTNRRNVLEDIRGFKEELSKIERAIDKGDSQALLKLLNKAKSIREGIL